ncbi:hypothetical protein EBT25_06470 [bacterium]|nr:hypothetical protein [bacterium]
MKAQKCVFFNLSAKIEDIYGSKKEENVPLVASQKPLKKDREEEYRDISVWHVVMRFLRQGESVRS